MPRQGTVGSIIPSFQKRIYKPVAIRAQWISVDGQAAQDAIKGAATGDVILRTDLKILRFWANGQWNDFAWLSDTEELAEDITLDNQGHVMVNNQGQITFQPLGA